MKYVSLVFAFLLPSLVLAAPYTLLVPLGPLSGAVTLKDYLQGVFMVTIGVAGILAVVMIVICSIQMMGAPSVSQKSASKECITNAIFGLLIALGSWILLNTINSDLVRSDLTLKDTTTAPVIGATGVTVESLPITPGWYFRYKDAGGDTRYKGPFSQASCNEIQAKASGDTTLSNVTLCFEVKGGAPPVITPSTPAPPPTISGVRCLMTGVNLCEPHMWRPGGTCTNNHCAPFASYAATNASGAATKELIKAIIWQESSCNTNAVGPVTKYGQACGPMQMLPSTANTLRNLCGISEVITCGYLTNPANVNNAICMGSKYIQKLAAGSCGPEIRNIAAGYNAGPVRCGVSAHCAADTSCGPGALGIGSFMPRQWECLYDDVAHLTCNTGLNETRRYATQVLYCKNNPAF